MVALSLVYIIEQFLLALCCLYLYSINEKYVNKVSLFYFYQYTVFLGFFHSSFTVLIFINININRTNLIRMRRS